MTALLSSSGIAEKITVFIRTELKMTRKLKHHIFQKTVEDLGCFPIQLLLVDLDNLTNFHTNHHNSQILVIPAFCCNETQFPCGWSRWI